MFPGREGRKATPEDFVAQVAIERFVEAVTTGKAARRRLSCKGVSTIRDWPAAMQRIVDFGVAHRDAQLALERTWCRLQSSILREQVDDDDLMFAGLRVLLPSSPYRGPGMKLFRGQKRRDPVGLSWTSDALVAINFSLFGYAHVNPNHLFSATKRGVPPQADGVLLHATVGSDRIISAPRSRRRKEREYVVDVRGLDFNIFPIVQYLGW